MSSSMLARFCSGLWIVNAELKSLEAFLEIVKSLGTNVTLIWWSIVVSRRMTKRLICV
jgi:hypothetical protein